MDEELKAPSGSPLEQLIGEDLTIMGLDELNQRITLLQGEIARSQAMMESKKGSRGDAEALFK